MSEESEDGQSGKVISSMVGAEKTPKNKSKKSPWRAPHLNFEKSKLKPSQLAFTKREVSKRKGPKKKMPRTAKWSNRELKDNIPRDDREK